MPWTIPGSIDVGLSAPGLTAAAGQSSTQWRIDPSGNSDDPWENAHRRNSPRTNKGAHAWIWVVARRLQEDGACRSLSFNEPKTPAGERMVAPAIPREEYCAVNADTAMAMKTITRILAGLMLLCMEAVLGQEAPILSPPLIDTNAEAGVKVVVAKGTFYRVEATEDLQQWRTLVTGQSAGTGTNTHTDSSAPKASFRFYRSASLSGTNHLAGDHLGTSLGDLIMHPVNHASLVMGWNGLTLYIDPVGGATLYKNFPKADMVLVTHSHSDHFDVSTVTGISTTNTVLVVPSAVYSGLTTALKKQALTVGNGQTTNAFGIVVEAVAAYNSNHPKGTGNGYVLNLGGRRVFLTGDTGDIAEVRALRNIDVAFVCMNVPYTMSVATAASVVREFKPGVVYPYHYRNQDNTLADLKSFRRLLGTDLGIELRLRAWY